MNIILCDDDIQELQDLEHKIRNHFKFGDNHSIKTYTSSRQLQFELEDLQADLFILDIDMPEPNGMTLAGYVRKQFPMAMLYFYTSHGEYATEGYRVEARRYLLKGGNPDYLYEALDYAASETERVLSECISLSYYRDTMNVPIADITYVRRENRLLSVHTWSSGVITASGNVKDLFRRIGRNEFVFIDRSTFINIDYVQLTRGDEVTLFSGEVLPVSRQRILDVKQAIGKHWKAR